ncbi:tuftelin-interacting protein 11 isoform X1 [Hydra vulgaris]|uniref:Tuftelin-interacting protein 11 n=2 Tax=Hydra vulgaris TaxID=6087 RepID=T2M4G5_HYDVU|nr:tuftelin-interacting protein 11 isoform X1 [Hydra vulgaris]
MASDEEFESFEITDFDLESELYPGQHKKQTKEQAIYGVWANSDDENDGHMQRKSRKKFEVSDYVDPMGFVSGGLFNEKGEADEKKDDEMNIPVISEERKKGFKSKTVINSKNFGAWEKYTTGFGSKMLEKMGYKGKGLGKHGEGITEPIEAFKRGGRAAIGAYGSETKKSREPVYDSEENEEIEIKAEIEKLHQWKKTGEESGKPKYVYKTAEEVKKSGATQKLAPLLSYGNNIKVVDMTGPETKVLQGYNAIGHQHAKPGEGEKKGIIGDDHKDFDIPELLYNLNLLVDLAESEIIQIDRQLRFEKDNVVNLTYEKERLDKVVQNEDIEINNLEHVLRIIDRCKAGFQPDNDEPLTVEGLVHCFQTLKDDFYEEYKLYNLDKLVVPLGFPLLARHFSSWQPFSEPTHGIEYVKLWKNVLESEQKNIEFEKTKENRSMSPFERIIWEIWMPHIRTAIGIWQAKNPDPLISVLEAWVQLIPDWVVANILDQLILPKLQAAVEFWNPLTDPVPIHSWIHPWLPLMGDRLEPLYPPIRHKLSAALTNWYPSDPSAKVILEPWVKVFSRGTMEAFLIRSIYPKLEQCMSEFKINPHQQILEPFHWVMAWKDIISVHHMVSILEKHLFPKLLQVLRKWLLNSPNYDEVTKWYLGWKSMFGAEYTSNPTIKEQFNRALALMNQAVSGTMQPGAKENVAYLTSTERRREAEQAFLSEKVQALTSSSIPTRFKDLVEQAAVENGLIFIPLPNRWHEGKTVYSFGKCVIYIDRDVVFYSTEGKWKPLSLQELIDYAK